jgi:hypothetical protein
MADLSQQLQLQQSINDAIKARNDLLAQQNKLLSTQSDLASKITQTVGSEKTTRQVRSMSNAIRESNSEISNGVDRAKELEDALNEAAEAAEDASGGFSMLGGAFGALSSVFSGGLSVLKSVGSAVLSIGASLAKAAFAVLSFPFKIFGALVDMAQQGAGGRPIAEAYEEVREVFGDLATGTGKAVSQTFEKLRNGTRELGQTGLSVRRVFGYGRDGLAALLKDINEQFAAAGDNISRLRKQFQEMGGNLVGFQRGLGMTKEEFAELASLSEIRGKSIADSFKEFGSTAIQTAKRFGLDVKDMAKGMKELNLDVENFGHLGPKAFAPITAYARKLGLEIKDMAGVMAKFSGFADTTEAASKLNQAFGLNIDSMKLMSAQNPAEKIDILRKSFFATGKDLSKFNYQQRQYLSSLTGLQGQSLEAAFALDKQGISYDNIAKESEKANKKQLTQKQVMRELSKGIKRLIQTMSGSKVTGFFDSFMKGFETGIMRSKQFRGVLRNIRRGLHIMRRFGIQIGRLFVKIAPGVSDMLEGLSEFLQPSKFRALTRSLKPLFETLFRTGDITKFVEDAAGALQGQFGQGGKGLAKMLKGMQEFGGFAVKVIANALSGIFDKLLTPMMAKVNEFFKEVHDKTKAGDGPFEAFYTTISDVLGRIEKEIRKSALGSALIDMVKPLTGLFDKGGAIANFGAQIEKTFGEGSKALEVITKMGEKIGEALMNGVKNFLTSPAGIVTVAALVGPSLFKAFQSFKLASAMKQNTKALQNMCGQMSNCTNTADSLSDALDDVADGGDGKGKSKRGRKVTRREVYRAQRTRGRTRFQSFKSAFVTGEQSHLQRGLRSVKGVPGKLKGGLGKLRGLGAKGLMKGGGKALMRVGGGLGKALPGLGVALAAVEGFQEMDRIANDPDWQRIGGASGENAAGNFAMGMLKGMTFGLVDLPGKVEAEMKRIKAMTDAAEQRQVNAMVNEAEGKRLIVEREFKELAKRNAKGKLGHKDLLTAGRRYAEMQMYARMGVDPAFAKEMLNNGQAKRKFLDSQQEIFDMQQQKILKETHQAMESQEIQSQQKDIALLNAKIAGLRDIIQLRDTLQALQKKMGTTTIETVAAKIDSVFKSTYKTIEIIGETLRKYDFGKASGMDPTMLKYVVGRIEKVAEHISPLGDAMSSLAKGFRDVISAVRTLKKTFRNLNQKTLKKDMEYVAQKLVDVPGMIIAGLSPLLGGTVKKSDVPAGDAQAVLSMLPSWSREWLEAGDLENKKKTIVSKLRAIQNFVEPVASSIGGISSGIKTLKKNVGKFPTISAADFAKFLGSKEKDGTLKIAMNELNKFALMLTDDTFGTISDTATGAKLVTVENNLESLGGVVSALSKVGKQAMRSKLSIKANYLRDTAIATKTAFESFNDAYTQATMVSEEETTMVRPIFDGLAKIKGGNVVVTHKHENLEMKVDVHINARDLGRTLLKTDVSTIAGKKRHISGHDGAPSFGTSGS